MSGCVDVMYVGCVDVMYVLVCGCNVCLCVWM